MRDSRRLIRSGIRATHTCVIACARALARAILARHSRASPLAIARSLAPSLRDTHTHVRHRSRSRDRSRHPCATHTRTCVTARDRAITRAILARHTHARASPLAIARSRARLDPQSPRGREALCCSPSAPCRSTTECRGTRRSRGTTGGSPRGDRDATCLFLALGFRVRVGVVIQVSGSG